MKPNNTTIALIIAGLCLSSWAMNGRHVTVSGNRMLLSTIRSNAVTAQETVGSDQVMFPQFSFDGTAVVCWRNTGGKWYLAKMDAASRTFTNLLDITTTWSEAPGGESIRWPAGDWIYFERPRSTGEIWRINSKEPAAKEMVLDYTTPANPEPYKIYGFALTSDVRLAMVALNSFAIWQSGHGGQLVHHFPPTGDDPFSADAELFNLPNCNPCLSPTGAVCGRFTDGGHEKLSLYLWNQTNQAYAPMTDLPQENGSAVFTTDIEAWSGQSDWAQVLEHPDFSVNSDRWIAIKAGQPGVGFDLARGCNTVVFSCRDRAAVKITSNGSGVCTGSGSLYIEDGPQGSWQDIDGNWVVVQPVVLLPSITVSGGNPYLVTLSSRPAGAEFYYTTDGSDPTQSSTRYTGAFNFAVPEDRVVWLKARAFMAGQTPSNIIRKRLLPVAPQGVGLTCDLWKDITTSSPGQVTDLTSDPRYPDNPDDSWIATSMSVQYGGWYTQSGEGGEREKFGYRLTGYIVPPLTGAYTFSMYSVWAGNLILGTSSDPASAQEIATFAGQHTRVPPGVSAPIQLRAGQWYYIEAHEVNSPDPGGFDTPAFSVRWEWPNGITETVPGVYLMPEDSIPPDPAAMVSPRQDNPRAWTPRSRSAGARVYDVSGKLVRAGAGLTPGSHVRVPAGVYFVQVNDGNRGGVSRVVVGRSGGPAH